MSSSKGMAVDALGLPTDKKEISSDKLSEMLRGIMSSVEQLGKEVKSIREAEKAKTKDPSKVRDAADAMYVHVCPYGTRPCDETEMTKLGLKCPVDQAPNPIIVDEKGNVCYAPADLQSAVDDEKSMNIVSLIGRRFDGITKAIEQMALRSPDQAGRLLSSLRDVVQKKGE